MKKIDKINENITSYYACDICGHNSPSNKQATNSNGVKFSYCMLHWRRIVEDFPISIKRAAKQEKFRDEFHNAFETGCE